MKMKVPLSKFHKLAKFIKNDASSKYVAEKQSPQAPNKPSVQPDEDAEEIVNKRNALKNKQPVSGVSSLYDKL